MGIPGRIGSVRPFAELARGATTTVLKGHDEQSDRIVVVKLLHREWTHDSDLVDRFAAEADALSSVDSRNVVRILDHGESDEGPYIVTEFVEGQTLESLIADRTVPAVIGAWIVREAVEGLSALHEVGLIHRDFKSANIIVGADGAVKLVDLGLVDSASRPAGVAAGTPGYIAPELLAGNPATTASDLYSVGVTLLEAATGRRARPENAKRQSLALPFGDLLAGIDEDLAALHRALVEADPSLRPAGCSDVVAQIDAILAHYRPAVTAATVSRWMAGERQTLPRRMFDEAAVSTDTPIDRTISGQASGAVRPGRDPEKPVAKTGRSVLFRIRGWHIAALLFAWALLVFAVRRQQHTAQDSPRQQSVATDSSDGTRPPQRPTANESDSGPTGSIETRPIETDSGGSTTVATGDSSLPASVALDTIDADPPIATDAKADSSRGSRAGNDAAVTPDSGRGTQSDPRPAYLSIAAAPWATVTIDGTEVGTTPLPAVIRVAPGTHRVTFANALFPEVNRQVDLKPGDTLRLTESMWSAVARVNISVTPWAEVLVDDVVRDTIPMSSPLIVVPGTRKITLRHPDIGTWDDLIYFEADSTYNLSFNMYELLDQ